MISLAHINARSLLNTFDTFQDHVLNYDYSIVGVSETWLHEDIDDLSVSLPGYTFVRQDRSSRGGGVGVYIKKDIKYSILLQECTEVLEHIWIKIFFGNITLILGNIYRPPSTNIDHFFQYYEDILTDLFSSSDALFCIGDFNIDMGNLGNKLSESLQSIADVFGLKQLITEPTRISNYSSSTIDLIFYNQDDVVDVGTRDIQVSDHNLIFCNIQTENKNADVSYSFKYRRLTSINKLLFQHDLENIPWHTFYDLDNANEKVEFLTSNIIRLFDKHAPVVNVKGKTKPYSPWITENIRLMIRLRNKALNRFRTTRNPNHWIYYKELRNLTTSAIRAEKKAYLNTIFRQGNTKQKWQELKKINVIKNKSNNIPEHLSNVNDLNNYFSSINTKNQNIHQDTLISFLNNRLNATTFLFGPVTDGDILQLIQRLKSNALGPDNLSLNLILYCCPFLVPHITHLVNSCICSGVFPDSWKQANIIPLSKCSRPKEFSDLRSISILPFLSKIMEKVMETQLNSFLNDNNILPEKQSGFRSGHSCETALAEVTDSVIRSLDRSMASVLIMLDYSKAFDTLNHELLLAMLKYIGLSDLALRLIRSYLTNRVQRVCIGSSISDMVRVTGGVPQGSILGPLLYSIYTFNIYKCLKHCAYHMYADDTQLIYNFDISEVQEANLKINVDLNSLSEVSKNLSLKLNPTKSIAVLFARDSHRPYLLRNLNLKLNNENITLKDSAKNLGLIIDYKLHFKEHITAKLRAAYSTLKMLYPHRHYLNQDTKKTLCESLVLSHFNFCDSIYGPCLDNVAKRRIQVLQNSCLRFIFGIRRRNHITYKLKEVQWLDMAKRRELHSISFYYKILKNRCPPYLSNKIKLRTASHTVNIRHRYLVDIPKHNREFFKCSFSYNVANLINKYKITDLTPSLTSFKKTIWRKLFSS